MDQREILLNANACHVVREYLHHFASPVRLRILCELTFGERSVGELVEAVGARQSALSQHLNLLKLAGLVEFTRDGSRNVYRISDPLARETMGFLLSLAGSLMERRPRAVRSPAEARARPASRVGPDTETRPRAKRGR